MPSRRVSPTPILLLILILSALGCETQAPGDDVGPYGLSYGVVAGEDYTLPDGVAPEPYSGYAGHPHPDEAATGIALRDWWVGWNELEPAEGQYDWDLFDGKLAQVAADGVELNIHLLSITRGGGNAQLGITVPNCVPEWVIEKFGLGEADLVHLGWLFDIVVVPGWREDIRAAFHELIAAFGARGYPTRDGVGAMYVHGISASRGEEFWLTRDRSRPSSATTASAPGRSVTFTLDDVVFDNRLPYGMDFRIVCDGPADVVVRWVRLVRGV